MDRRVTSPTWDPHLHGNTLLEWVCELFFTPWDFGSHTATFFKHQLKKLC